MKSSPSRHPAPPPMRPLSPGDRVAVVAPASPFKIKDFEAGCRRLTEAGFEVVHGRHVMERTGYLAGTEAQRADDLVRALRDPDVHAVICARGGYGSGRLLPFLPYADLKAHPKPFLGFSDITFLHAAFHRRMGWATFHGPNATGFAWSEVDARQALDALTGKAEYAWELHQCRVLRDGEARGPLFGGNLTCLAHLVGTGFSPPLDGALLLVEDTNEKLYRLDRLFTQLRLSGRIRGLAGLIIGNFKNCGEAAPIVDMIYEQVRDFDFPVVGGLPFGHDSENYTLVLGAPYLLNTHDRVFKLLRSPFSQ